jgi:DNA-binding IclR family transcriptional regulator
LAQPVRRLDGRVVASLNIGAQSERCPAKTMQGALLPKLRETAATLRQQLV